jgi:hypothetical protein
MNKYPNSGRLNYAKNKVNPNSADIYGEIVFDRQYLRDLLNETDQDDIPVKLSGWQKDGNYGPWFAIRVNTYKKENPYAPQKVAPKEENFSTDGMTGFEDLPF